MGGVRCLGLFPKKNRFFWTPALNGDGGSFDQDQTPSQPDSAGQLQHLCCTFTFFVFLIRRQDGQQEALNILIFGQSHPCLQ